MAKIVYRRITIDGLEVFYREAGRPSAPAILLLHGFPTASHMFRELMPPLPPLPDVSTYDGQRTNLERLKAFAKENLTTREIARRISNAGTGPVMAGTPAEIADEMEAWYVAGAADGFNLMFPLLPDDWLNFAELVVPELQRRGLTRKEYAVGTLRDRLGLPRPPNRFTSNSSARMRHAARV